MVFKLWIPEKLEKLMEGHLSWRRIAEGFGILADAIGIADFVDDVVAGWNDHDCAHPQLNLYIINLM